MPRLRGLRLTNERRLLPVDGPGWVELREAPGEPLVERNELGGDPSALADASATVLLRLLHLTDLHVMDAASPARCEWVDARADDPKWRPLLHMARAYDTLANWGVAAMVSSCFAGGAGPIELAVSSGDNIDNAQRNELDAFITLLGGGRFAFPYDGGPQRVAAARDPRADHLRVHGQWPFWLPEGGADDVWRTRHGFPVLAELLDEAGGTCSSPGLGLPWLSVLGNHDVMRQGTIFSTAGLEAIAIGGEHVISPGTAFDPDDPLAAYLADGASFSSGPVAVRVAPAAGRRSVDRAEFIRAHLEHGAHGFVSEDSGDYVHDTEHVRLIVLDTNHPAGHYQGSIGAAQLDWLDEMIRAAGRPVVVVTHHGRVALVNTYGEPSSDDRRLGDAMAEVLHRHDHVIAWIAGHRHVHRIAACPDPTGRGPGFWEITTSSVIDWPNQARIVEVVRGSDGSVGVRTVVVDHGAVNTSEDAEPLERLAALHRQVACSSGRVLGERGREGAPGDRNALLARPPR